jgi:hypothetical protein
MQTLSRVPLTTSGTEPCDAAGGALRPKWREWPARGIRWALSQRVAFAMLLAALFGLLVARFPRAGSLGVWE